MKAQFLPLFNVNLSQPKLNTTSTQFQLNFNSTSSQPHFILSLKSTSISTLTSTQYGCDIKATQSCFNFVWFYRLLWPKFTLTHMFNLILFIHNSLAVQFCPCDSHIVKAQIICDYACKANHVASDVSLGSSFRQPCYYSQVCLYYLAYLTATILLLQSKRLCLKCGILSVTSVDQVQYSKTSIDTKLLFSVM